MPRKKKVSVPFGASYDEQEVDDEAGQGRDDPVVGLDLSREDGDEGPEDGETGQGQHHDAQGLDPVEQVHAAAALFQSHSRKYLSLMKQFVRGERLKRRTVVRALARVRIPPREFFSEEIINIAN